jgi:hypothetical protein
MDIDRRMPLWRAMADLFLDTELQEYQYRHLARVVVESGFTPQEVHDILWDEVFPALGDNLRSVAGEWAGFNDEWLRKRIVEVHSGGTKALGTLGLISVKDVREIVAEAWAEVGKLLPPEFADAQRK